MNNIYLIRHGESEGNVDPTVYQRTADHAIALSERGQRQARAAGEALRGLMRFDPREPLRIWCSPYRRTRQTADAIEAALLPQFPKLDRPEHINVCEQQFGVFDGVPDEELPTLFPREHEHLRRTEDHEG